MKLVRCIEERKDFPGQISIGTRYWMNENSVWKDSDGDEYAQVYLDEDKQHWVGNMLTSHFEAI